MTAFTVFAYFVLVCGFYITLRGIYLFEKKNDDRALKFLVVTCPHRYKFTAGTALFLILAGYFGAMALIPLIIVNYIVGWYQFFKVRNWVRTYKVGVPPNHPAK
ncbi:hypothetical protein [Streptomyces sp. CHB9.2]|uniref:hypothetical protein n=1 Tax=Streptomyces sp. CHB9.2 TaxID=2841670 RepID=UPI002095F7B9|nr:hypothetical protein [Streptomyces sp. CHB9.2]MCO6704708.1 hypothetical protein [Streptomyces sp. CHB9.2]